MIFKYLSIQKNKKVISENIENYMFINKHNNIYIINYILWVSKRYQ